MIIIVIIIIIIIISEEVKTIEELLDHRKVYFKDPSNKERTMDCDGYPFVILGRAYYECQYGRPNRPKVGGRVNWCELIGGLLIDPREMWL